MMPSNCVLIVDDDENARDTLEALLFKENYQLITASYGHDALEKAATFLPDLILLDVMMPGMNGFETCQKIRQDPLLQDVPVILVTALDDRDSRIAGIESGADDFISKPYDKVELRTRVRSVLRLNRYRKLLGERLKFEWIAENTREAFLLLHKDDVISYANPQAQKYLELTETQIDEGDIRFLSAVDKVFQREHNEWRFWTKGTDDLNRARYLVRPESNNSKELWLRVEVLELPEHVAEHRLIELIDASSQMQLRRRTWTFQDAVAHKLLTPLNALQGLMLLRHEQLAQLNPEHQALIDGARRGVTRLTRQVQEIINYVNHVPKLVSQKEPTSIKALQPLLSRLQEFLELPHRIKLDIQPELEQRTFSVASELLEIALRELLTNAKKFHPQETPRIYVTLTPDRLEENLACCTIIDDGKHIPPEHLENLMLPYYQDEKFFTGETEGMGLGLNMVSSLMRGVGGYCRINNRDDGKSGVQVNLGIPLL